MTDAFTGYKGGGRPAMYRPKNRNRSMSISLTDEGRDHLDEQREVHGLSRPDYIEAVLRGDIPVKRLSRI